MPADAAALTHLIARSQARLAQSHATMHMAEETLVLVTNADAQRREQRFERDVLRTLVERELWDGRPGDP